MGRYILCVYWISIHVQRGLDEEKIVYLSATVVSLAVLIRRYQMFLTVMKVSNMIERGGKNYGL